MANRLMIAAAVIFLGNQAAARSLETDAVSAAYDYCLDMHFDYFKGKITDQHGEGTPLTSSELAGLISDPAAENAQAWEVAKYLNGASRLVVLTYTIDHISIGEVGRCSIIFESSNADVVTLELQRLLAVHRLSDTTFGNNLVQNFVFSLMGIDWNIELLTDPTIPGGIITTTRLLN